MTVCEQCQGCGQVVDGTPVVVVFFRIPVAKPPRLTPFTLVTVPDAVTLLVPSNDGLVHVTSPVIAIVLPVASAVAVAAFPLVFWLSVGNDVSPAALPVGVR